MLFRQIPKVDKIQKKLSHLPKNVLLPVIHETLDRLREDIKNKKIMGVEGLIRWLHPKRGLLSPFYFIQYAEKSDLIVKIDKKSRFVMKDAKELIDFVEPLTEINFKYKKRVLILNWGICSKSKQFLKNWRIIK